MLGPRAPFISTGVATRLHRISVVVYFTYEIKVSQFSAFLAISFLAISLLSDSRNSGVLLCFRITPDNVEDIWILANRTTNANLMESCVPMLLRQVDTLNTKENLLSQTNVEGLRMLLANWHIEDMAEEVKLRVICAWIEAGVDEKIRARHFTDFLPILELNKLSNTFLENLYGEKTEFEIPDSC